MSYSTLWVSTNSGTIQNVGTPRFSTGPHDRSTKNTWNGSSQRELNHKSAVRNVRGRSDRNRWHRQLQLGPVHPAGQPTRSRSAPKPPARKPAARSGNRQRHREIRQTRTPEGRLATAPSAHNPARSSQLSKQQVGPACVLSPLLGPVGLRPLLHPAAWISRGSCRPAVTGRPNGDLFYRRNELRDIRCGQPVVSTHGAARAARASAGTRRSRNEHGSRRTPPSLCWTHCSVPHSTKALLGHIC